MQHHSVSYVTFLEQRMGQVYLHMCSISFVAGWMVPPRVSSNYRKSYVLYHIESTSRPILGGYWGGSWIHIYGSKKIKDLILAYKHNLKKLK
jgi:hypothetical protein